MRRTKNRSDPPRKTKSQLVEENRALHEAIDAISDGFIFFDKDDKVVAFNKRQFDLFPSLADVLAPGLPYRDLLKAQANSGRISAASGREDAWIDDRIEQHQIADGVSREQIFANGKTFRLSEHRTSSGGIVAIRTDITELKALQNELQQKEARFRDIAETASDWFWEMDADLRFTYLSENVERVVGTPPEWHYGKTREDLLGDDYDQEIWGQHLQALRARQPFRDFTYHRIGEGVEPKWLSSSGNPVFDANDNFLGYHGTGRDVTELRQREIALLQSEQNLREILDKSPIGVAIVLHTFGNDRVEAKRLYINDALLTMFGGTVRDDYGETDISQSWVDVDQLYEVNKSMSSGVELVDFECLRRRLDGTELWISMNTGPIRFNDQACIMVWHFDITARKKAEEALRQSESRLRTIIDNYPWLITLKDLEGRYLLVNEYYGKSRNIPVEQAIGKTAAEIEVVEQAAIVDAHDQEVIKKKEIVIYERDVIGQDDARVTLSIIKFPAYDADGEMMGIGTISTNITERKRAEDALRQRESLLNAVIENVPVSLSLKDREGRFTLVNPTFELFHGVSANEILGKTFFDILPHEVATAAAGEDREVMESGKSMRTDYSWPRHLREQHEIIIKFPIRSDDTAPVTGVGVIALDVTQQKRQEEQLRHSQKMEAVGQLTGGIAHDFNNLLAAVIGNLNLLEESEDIGEEFDRKCIATALRASLRGAELTHRLLAFSRQQDLFAKTTLINEILPQFVQLAERTIGEDIAIELKLATDLWLVVVDIGELENALLNLALNARDAMPEGGHLIIETANRVLDEDHTAKSDDLAPGDYVTVTVSDDGAGMPAEVRARVFEPFFTTKDVGEGSGLGLSMVFGFAQQSGGKVSVYSEEGEGTTVRIYLPREDETELDESTAEVGEPDRPTGHDTILVVEDDEYVRRYLVTVLGRLGYTVLEAGDGPAALEVMAASGPIDLLLTDMILPRGMSGRDVAAALSERHPAAGVLYSSGYTREILNRRGGLDEGAALLGKPYQTHGPGQARAGSPGWPKVMPNAVGSKSAPSLSNFA